MNDSLFDFPEEKQPSANDDNQDKDPLEITLYYPPAKWLENRAKELNEKYTKYDLENKYSSIISNLKYTGVKFRFEPAGGANAKVYPDDIAKARTLVRLFFENSVVKLKLDWARLVALLECDPRNFFNLIKQNTDSKGIALMLKLVDKHCMTADEAWHELGYDTNLTFEHRYYFYGSSNMPKEWMKSHKTKILNSVAYFAYGPNYSHTAGVNPYNAPRTIFLLPQSDLVLWGIATKYDDKAPDLNPEDNANTDNLVIFNSVDFITQLPIFEGLKTSGIIKPGVNKVPNSVGKKISSMMTLEQLPQLDYTISNRYHILAFLGAYADFPTKAVEKSDKKNVAKEGDSTIKLILKALYDRIEFNDNQIVRFLLEDSITRVSKYALDEIRYSAKIINKVIATMISKLPTSPKNPDYGAWVKFEKVMDWILYNEALATDWVNWFNHSSFQEISSSEFLSYPDYFARVKQPVIIGLLQMYASIGIIDIAFDDTDTDPISLKYIRITNVGLWLGGRTENLKIEVKKADDGLHFDPDTLMITIKDTNSPNFALLNDLTEKITNNRYKITAAALLRNCRTSAELFARVDRLKDYLLNGAESPALSMLISGLYLNINKIKPTTDTEYYCLDVDPEDKRLHRLIITDSQIRKNTLRVEGWKLLVKKSFYSTFIDKLRQAGYLTET